MGVSMTHPLRNPDYRRLFMAQVMSLVGTGLTTVALALLAHDLAGGSAGAVLGTVLALKMVAYVLVAPAVGGVVHRLPRKAVLVALDLLRAAIVLFLPFVDTLWQVYGLIVALNIAAAGFTPTFQATLPDILPEESQYTRALSLSRLAYDLENLASPTLAALALTFVSFDGLFVADSITFVLSALLVTGTAIPAAQIPERIRGTWANTTFGLRAYLKTPRLRGLLALHLAASAAGAMVIVNTVVYVHGRLGLGDSETAWAMAAAGGGSMLMALLAPKILARSGDRALMVAGACLLSVGLVVGGLHRLSLWELLCLWFALGLGMSAIQTPAGRLLRRSCQPGDRAAYFSAEFALSHAGWFIAYLGAGLLGALLGLETAFLALGVLALCGALGALMLWPSPDPQILSHVHEPLEHEHMHVHDVHHEHTHEGGEGPAPHRHGHRHQALRHEHAFVIDLHHERWPRSNNESDHKCGPR